MIQNCAEGHDATARVVVTPARAQLVHQLAEVLLPAPAQLPAERQPVGQPHSRLPKLRTRVSNKRFTTLLRFTHGRGNGKHFYLFLDAVKMQNKLSFVIFRNTRWIRIKVN